MANRYMQVMISRIKDFERNACNTIDPGSDSKQLTSALETFRGTVINVALFSEAAKELRDRVHGLPKRVKNVFDFIDQDRQTTKETNKTYIKNNEIRHKLKTEVKIHTVVFLGITLAVNRIKSLKINDFQEICRLAEQYIQVHNLKSDLEQKEFLLVIPGWIKSIPKWAGDYEVFKETVVRKCLSKNLANDNAGCEADEPAPKKRKVLPLVVKQIDGDQALTSIRRRPDLVDSRAILDACEPGSDQPLCLSFFPRAETASLFESLSIGIDQSMFKLDSYQTILTKQ
ncbi:hypothetical protein FOXG_20966 [Fusarium oxysporum f. sp. lycopersici 4287]|uniref:Uncharacterized protein n=1 Tax=Fusarium oxysporum f. sp. lycopersici (strain 4287 / CBS 123668 / FGSC 9935 / NRRL 34936) TaxID=426428 RepID=A0A0J9VTB6_FUSO4|nr:hypothetical protein FOXG_20966 [Fusarium oxysporum f. sp. lycopersici 4287]EWZ79305.1 hypothetical protein FOWG_16578 [Fusarium oxysporum f. sp. lycopersici MN25]KNB13890.1 hypothetical protein FOXG_20966 [Fusarium oxysporum f. sp. lycopersici 4287]